MFQNFCPFEPLKKGWQLRSGGRKRNQSRHSFFFLGKWSREKW